MPDDVRYAGHDAAARASGRRPAPRQPARRHAGILAPLFSFPSTLSWGLGEIGDIGPMAAWLREAHQDVLQILPINALAPGETSPYSPISAMALDPQFISVHLMEDLAALGGEAALGAESQRLLAAVRRAAHVDYAGVRQLKDRAMRAAFARFRDAEWRLSTARAASLGEYIRSQAWWLDDYALFRALRRSHDEQPWTAWEPPLRDRDPAAIAHARAGMADEILFQQYLQWIADRQWQEARRAAAPVKIIGDFPFMVAADSADVWARQTLFRLDASVGVPPDAFSREGQNWGLPVYRWGELRRRKYDWLADRARRSAALYDGYRIDHLVGFYRTYAIPHDGSRPYFTPASERRQIEQGERLMALFLAAGVEIIAEDLGTVPDFVRSSIARLGVPGYRVLRWEREWGEKGQPFRDPAHYPALSVATSGTHDTPPMAVWWETASEAERARLLEIPGLRRLSPAPNLQRAPFDDVRRDALLEELFASGSSLLILPIQDVFGWRDRINEPATIQAANWTFRLPWPADRLADQPEVRERADALRAWSERHGRG